MYIARQWRLPAAIALAVAAMVLLQGAQPVTEAQALDLGSEIRVLDSYVDDLAAFDNKCALLEKKGSVIRTDLEPFRPRPMISDAECPRSRAQSDQQSQS